MAGMFNLGGVLNAIKPPKLSQINYSDPLNQAWTNAISRINGTADTNDADINDFSGSLKTARATDASTQAGDMSLLNRVAKRLADTSGTDTYRTLGDINTGLATKATANLASLGEATDKLMQSRLGLGGRGPSTYQSITNQDRAGRNAAPIWAQVISSLAPGVQSVMSNDRANAASLADTINEKAAVPYRGLDTILAPGTARNANILAFLQSLGITGQGIKNNTAGFKEEKNKWAAGIGAIDDSLNSAVDTAMQLYGGMSGGGAGGMLGGLFGGGGGRAQPAAGDKYAQLMTWLNTA